MTAPHTSQEPMPLGERLASRWLDDWRGAAAVVVLLALASSITGLTNGFAYDDLPIIVETDRLHDWRQLWQVFGQSYWHGPGAPQDLYRPLILVWFGLQWAVGGGNPLVFHSVSIALYAGLAVVVLALVRRLLPTRPAAVGAMLWAVHPVHVEAVGNVVGQAELLTSLAVLVAVVTYLRSRMTQGLTGRVVLAIATVYPLALLTKEHAVTLPLLLGAVELVLWHRGGLWRPGERARGWLLGRILVYETLLYLALRWAVLPSLHSVPHFALYGLSAAERVRAAIALWPEVARLLLWPARLYADYSPQLVTVHATWHPIHLLSLAMLGVWGWGGWRAWRARPDAAQGAVLLGLLWFPITFALVSNLLFASGILVAERTLFLPSLSVALLAGAGVQLGLTTRRVSGRLLGILCALLLSAGVWRSADRQRSWADSITVFSTMVGEAPNNARSLTMLGRLYLRLGALDKAGPYLERGFRLEPSVGTAYVVYLQRVGRCEAAVVTAKRVLEDEAANEELENSRVACMLQLRRFSEARSSASLALARGFSPTTYTRFQLVADSLLAASDTVDLRNRWVREGRPVSRTNRPFTVTLLERPAAFGSGMLSGGRHSPQ